MEFYHPQQFWHQQGKKHGNYDSQMQNVQQNLRKGECFRCEKFGLNHICKNTQFKVIIVVEEDEKEEKRTLLDKPK